MASTDAGARTAPAEDSYHEGMRRLQDRFDSRRLADRLSERLSRTAFSGDDRAFVERSRMFFLASADEQGRPDCSVKAGEPGFVRVIGDSELAFPSYDGNGMFRSLGNLLVNPAVGLLFVDWDRPGRLRVNGSAAVCDPDDPLMDAFAGAQLVVRVAVSLIFPNCSRSVHRMALVEPSAYLPRAGHEPPQPAWKSFEAFRDVLPRGDRSRQDPAS